MTVYLWKHFLSPSLGLFFILQIIATPANKVYTPDMNLTLAAAFFLLKFHLLENLL